MSNISSRFRSKPPSSSSGSEENTTVLGARDDDADIGAKAETVDKVVTTTAMMATAIFMVDNAKVLISLLVVDSKAAEGVCLSRWQPSLMIMLLSSKVRSISTERRLRREDKTSTSASDRLSVSQSY